MFDDTNGDAASSMDELNEMTSAALSLDRRERALVHDLVRVRLELNDGKLGETAVRVYFNRNLRIYEGTQTFIFKPWQRFHWTESQALFDAREVIAETLSGGEVC